MEYTEDVVTILSKLNRDNIEQTISEPYIKKGARKTSEKTAGRFQGVDGETT